MATGFADYVLYLWTNPALALERCGAHLTALLEQQGARTTADGVTYDPEALNAAIERARLDFDNLNKRINGVGQPRLLPTRRYDPGPNVGIAGNGSSGSPGLGAG